MRIKRKTIDEEIECLIIVSDSHAFIEPLQTLNGILDGFPEQTQIIACGDYFSGGASPVEVLEWVHERAGEFAVVGNHDEGKADRNAPIYTQEGAIGRLDVEQRQYLQSLSHSLELGWKDKKIWISHDFAISGERFNWRSNKKEILNVFKNYPFDLTVMAHTHYPFVSCKNDKIIANCGSVSGIILGHRQVDGTISSKGEERVFAPVSKIYSTFLSVMMKNGELQVNEEHFDYDREAALRRLQELGDPCLEKRQVWMKNGVV